MNSRYYFLIIFLAVFANPGRAQDYTPFAPNTTYSWSYDGANYWTLKTDSIISQTSDSIIPFNRILGTSGQDTCNWSWLTPTYWRDFPNVFGEKMIITDSA